MPALAKLSTIATFRNPEHFPVLAMQILQRKYVQFSSSFQSKRALKGLVLLSSAAGKRDVFSLLVAPGPGLNQAGKK